MRADFDIAVVGSGFGGSLMAMIARQLGCSVVLLERGRHPRFAIGESSTPLANLLLEELARRYALPRLRPRATGVSSSMASASAGVFRFARGWSLTPAARAGSCIARWGCPNPRSRPSRQRRRFTLISPA